MDEPVSGLPKYPTLKLVVRYGNWAGVGLAIIVLLLVLGVAMTTGSILIGLIGIVLAVLAYVLTKVFVELISLITDMLLPQ